MIIGHGNSWLCILVNVNPDSQLFSPAFWTARVQERAPNPYTFLAISLTSLPFTINWSPIPSVGQPPLALGNHRRPAWIRDRRWSYRKQRPGVPSACSAAPSGQMRGARASKLLFSSVKCGDFHHFPFQIKKLGPAYDIRNQTLSSWTMIRHQFTDAWALWCITMMSRCLLSMKLIY